MPRPCLVICQGRLGLNLPSPPPRLPRLEPMNWCVQSIRRACLPGAYNLIRKHLTILLLTSGDATIASLVATQGQVVAMLAHPCFLCQIHLYLPPTSRSTILNLPSTALLQPSPTPNPHFYDETLCQKKA